MVTLEQNTQQTEFMSTYINFCYLFTYFCVVCA